MKDFWSFVNERASIFYKRYMGESPPWTDDPVLQKYKFCNVYRELDRGTQYVIRNILFNPELSEQEKLLNLIFYRFFNLPETHDSVKEYLRLSNLDLDMVSEVLHKRRDEGMSVFSDAYMITGKSSVSRSRDKIKMLMDVFRKDIVPKLNMYYGGIKFASTMEEAWKVLRQVPNLGDFISYQVLLDWAYINRYPDFDAWVFPGPGAVKGLEIIYGKKFSMSEAQKAIQKLCEEGKTKYHWIPPLHIHNVENCLCEYSKYVRLWKGDSHVRPRLFSPRSWEYDGWIDPWTKEKFVMRRRC